MTHNQIAYWGNQLTKEANEETARHNRAMEANQTYSNQLTKEYNDRLAAYNEKMANIKAAEAAEAARHNYAYESISSTANWYNYELGSQTLMYNNQFREQELAYTGQRVANETRLAGSTIRRENVQNLKDYKSIENEGVKAMASLIQAGAAVQQAITQTQNVKNQYKLGVYNALLNTAKIGLGLKLKEKTNPHSSTR
jgi:hypothetical protein